MLDNRFEMSNGIGTTQLTSEFLRFSKGNPKCTIHQQGKSSQPHGVTRINISIQGESPQLQTHCSKEVWLNQPLLALHLYPQSNLWSNMVTLSFIDQASLLATQQQSLCKCDEGQPAQGHLVLGNQCQHGTTVLESLNSC